jgi:hypothetical protein
MFLDRGMRYGAAGRPFEDSRQMPAALRPNDHVGVPADADGLGMAIDLGDHFHIVEVREHELLAAFEHPEAETAPEIDQPLLRVAIKAAIPLLPAQLDRGSHHLKRQTRVAEFLANGEAFDLGEIGEIADAQAACGFIPDIADLVRRREIVAVEFLFVRTFLLADIDGAPQARDPHEIFEGSRYRDRDRALTRIAAIGVIERNIA